MTHDKTLNARITDALRRSRHHIACADVLAAKMRCDMAGVKQAEQRAQEALHDILRAGK